MRELFAFLSCVLIWGSTWYAIEFQVGDVPPTWSVSIRFFISAAILFTLCLFQRRKLSFTLKEHLPFLGVGLFLFSLNYVMIYYGTLHLTSGLVALAFSLLGVFNLLSSRIFLKQKADPTVLLASSVGIAGLAIIFQDEIIHFTLESSGSLGLLFCLAGTCLASLGNMVAASQRARSLPLLSLNAYGMAYGGIFNSVFALLRGDPFILSPEPDYWIAMLYLSIFGTVIAFTVYLWLISRIGVARAAYVAVAMPLVALVISTFFEGFHWTPEAITGVILVLAGNVIMARRRQAQIDLTVKAKA